MWDSTLFLTALREFRWWTAPSTSCPWGFIYPLSHICLVLVRLLLWIVVPATGIATAECGAPAIGPVGWGDRGPTTLQRRFSEHRA